MKVDNILKYISIFTALFISCSCFKLIIYYNQFNLSIVEFLSFQEVIVLFIEDIIRYVTIIIIPLVIYLIPKVKSERESDLLFFVVSGIILVFSSFGFFFINKYVSKLNTNDILILSLIIFIFCILVLVLKNKRIVFSLTQKNISKFDGFIILFTIFLFISTFLYSQSFSEKVKYSRFYEGTKIITDSDTLISNNDSFFIGKTQEYVFFYLLQLKETLVIPKKNIVRLQLKSKEYSVPIFFIKSLGRDHPIQPPPR